jgi:hypothetical protein
MVGDLICYNPNLEKLANAQAFWSIKPVNSF